MPQDGLRNIAHSHRQATTQFKIGQKDKKKSSLYLSNLDYKIIAHSCVSYRLPHHWSRKRKIVASVVGPRIVKLNWLKKHKEFIQSQN